MGCLGCCKTLGDRLPCLGKGVFDNFASTGDLGCWHIENRGILAFEKGHVRCLSLGRERERAAACRVRGFVNILAHGASGVGRGSDARVSSLFRQGGIGGARHRGERQRDIVAVVFQLLCGSCKPIRLGGKLKGVVTQKVRVG